MSLGVEYYLREIARCAKEAQIAYEKLAADMADLNSPLGKLQQFERITFQAPGAKVEDGVTPALEANYRATLEAVRRNAEKVRHNATVINYIIQMCVGAGINYTEIIPSNGRKPVRVSIIEALKNAAPSKGFGTPETEKAVTDAWDDFVKRAGEYRQRQQKEQETRMRAAENARAAAAAQNQRIAIAIAANLHLQLNADMANIVSSVVEKLLKRDKYLRLAEAMKDTWYWYDEDGFWRIEEALETFKIDTPTDQEIFAELREVLGSEEDGGRVLRDCKWNYAKIRELADRDVAAAYASLVEE